MLPNQFCYQIPLQFFAPQILPDNMSGLHNYNTFPGYPYNPIIQTHHFPTAFQNNPTYFNYIPCQMQMADFITQSEE